MIKKFLLVTFLLSTQYNFSQEKVLYKQINDVKLFLDVYYPKNMDTTKQYPAIVFFFGGGWIEGNIKKFERQAIYFSKRGLVSFLVDYRIQGKHKTTPFESLKDAKSAIRFIKENSQKFHVDSSKIIASGGSAGGHLAVATALIEEFNEITDNLKISSKPSALVLFNPVIDNGPGGYGYARIGDEYKKFSPLHNIKKEAPPTIIFLGTEDVYIPVETAKYYKKVMEKVGSRCDLFLYDGAKHTFFNNNKYYKEVLLETDKFLQFFGYLEENPKIKIE
jgi:acetyl esterase/lipase